ncbi:MAG: family 1 glycosylhydrolase [Hymenobacter sp.]
MLARRLGDRVGHWLVLNEPMVFVGAGHLLGVHAPGRRSLPAFPAAAHHATLAQAEGVGRCGRCCRPRPHRHHVFVLLRGARPARPRGQRGRRPPRGCPAQPLFTEPTLGLGYPTAELPALGWLLRRYHQAGDDQRMQFNFDFWGVQNYTREVVRRALAAAAGRGPGAGQKARGARLGNGLGDLSRIGV